ncbi:MAG: 50S ribosomal protein L31 [bacterium]|nr:50S ribosomal protein L31 [bacterium]
MKKDIHPQYSHSVKVACSCGNTFATGSTVEKIETELCSACHPFYTGTQKIVDAAHRVERFATRLGKKGTLESRVGKKEKQARDSARRKAKLAEATQ